MQDSGDPPGSLASPRLASPRLASPHLTTPHLISPHHTTPHRTTPHLTSPHLASPRSPRLASPHLTSPRLTSPHYTSPHLTSTECSNAAESRVDSVRLWHGPCLPALNCPCLPASTLIPPVFSHISGACASDPPHVFAPQLQPPVPERPQMALRLRSARVTRSGS